MTMATPTDDTVLDPLPLLRGLVSLRKLTGMYPAGHPAIAQKLDELDGAVRRHLDQTAADTVEIDVIHGDAHVGGLAFRRDAEADRRIIAELAELGVDSVRIDAGVTRDELVALSEFLWRLRDTPAARGPIDAQLADRGIRHVTLGKLLALDTRWRAEPWPDSPADVADPAYAESLDLMQRTFDDVSAGRGVERAMVQHIVQLLVRKVTRSSAALAQILAVKLYENLTYCHSVNVATLSLLIARQLGFGEAETNAIGEAALLHDIGKTRIPLDVIRKPGALDRRERRLMEAHTTLGAGILIDVDGLGSFTPTVALEHHRSVKGSGYPDLGEGVVPHLASQLVSVADIYEAMTGARTYQDPGLPEQACLVLARLAGSKLNTALVKAFVGTITFFPVGSVVRTSRDETGVVVGTTPAEPLHPTLALVGPDLDRLPGVVDTSARDESGAYLRHIAETIRPPDGLRLTAFVH